MSSDNMGFKRGMTMLEYMEVDDLIRFWMGFGPCRLGPSIEHVDPWYKGLPNIPKSAS